MDKITTAREAIAIGDQFDLMKDVPCDHLDVYLQDVRARLDLLGFTLEDVVRTGVQKLANLSNLDMNEARRFWEPEPFVRTSNWEEAIRTVLLPDRAEFLSWADRAFVEKMLISYGSITPDELYRVDRIVRDVEVACYRADKVEEAEMHGRPVPAPSDADYGAAYEQLWLDL